MGKIVMASATAAAFICSAVSAGAHHSMALYEFGQITVEGIVQEFRYINPHSVLVLRAANGNGGVTIWHLEGDAPAMLAREGVSSTSFRPGDHLKLGISRLKSGENGGMWNVRTIYTQNGREFVGHLCMSSPDHCTPQ
jgi:hypothetical protein